MDLALLQGAEHLRVNQRFAMMINRYDVTIADGAAAGTMVGFAEQKRMSLRERVTIFTDDSRREVLCSYAARQVFDVGATYDVTDAAGAVIGSFRKDFARSLLGTTFHLEQAGAPAAMGQERNLVVALVRRATDAIPLPVHFDFAAEGQKILSITRAFSVRDSYDVVIPAPGLDRRLAIAVTVALDALLAR